MNERTAVEAASLLWRCVCEGAVIEALPDALRPADAAQGHAIQAQLPTASGMRIAGWKIAATSQAGQRHINVNGPLPGRILSGLVVEAGSEVSLDGNRMRVAEPEFAFRFGRTLPPRAVPYATDDVLQAVESLHPALEVPDSRYAVFTRAGEAQLIADNACCGRFAFGAPAPERWRAIDLAAHAVHATVTGADGRVRFTRDGEGRAALGDPRAALAWLVNEASLRGVSIEAGQLVSTGTCMVPLEIAPGDAVHADFGVLGAVSLRFALTR
jgi:2-keto-4-pentenoate hydratase